MTDFTKEQLDKAVSDAVAKATGPLAQSITKLEANNAALVDEKKTAKEKADEKTAAAVKAAEESARKSGDFEAMDKSWAEKYAKLESDNKAAGDTTAAAINKLTAGAAVKDIAAAMALKGSEGIFEQIIKGRVGVEMREGEAIVQILDKAGKPSAATLDDFKKELSEDAAMKPLLSGSQGSGGGAANQNGGAGDLKTGDMGGGKAERTAALKAQHPELS